MEENRRRSNNNCRWSTSSRDDDVVSIDKNYPMKCSGKCCRSCGAGMIADCVAVCCCPLAVVSFLVLTLVKAPVMIGRRCLGGFGKNGRRRKAEMRKKKMMMVCESSGRDMMMMKNGVLRVEEGTSEIVFSFGDGDEDGDEEKYNLSGRFEAERIWLELHQLGHLAFGRVSFTGIPTLPKPN